MTDTRIAEAMDKLIRDQEQRHSWLMKAAEQVRCWKAEDARNGIERADEHGEGRL